MSLAFACEFDLQSLVDALLEFSWKVMIQSTGASHLLNTDTQLKSDNQKVIRSSDCMATQHHHVSGAVSPSSAQIQPHCLVPMCDQQCAGRHGALLCGSGLIHIASVVSHPKAMATSFQIGFGSWLCSCVVGPLSVSLLAHCLQHAGLRPCSAAVEGLC